MDVSEALYSSDSLVTQAIARLERLCEQNPGNTDHAARLARFYRCAGDLGKAAQLLETCGESEQQALRVLRGSPDWTRLNAGTGLWPFFHFQDWLQAGELAEAWATVTCQPEQFTPSLHGHEGAPIQHSGYRISEVLDGRHFRSFAEQVFAHLLERAADALAYFGISDYTDRTREIQITRHGAGGRYKIHRDRADSGTAAGRLLTFVYYFHRQPKEFSGGDLLLFDKEFTSAEALRYTRFAPLHNSLLLFPSDAYHMVEPVRMQHDDFLAGRFTVNGWIHAPSSARERAR